MQNLGDITGARVRMRQALRASRRQGELFMSGLSLYYLAVLENFTGRFGRSVACAQKARRILLRLGDRLRGCGILFYESLAEGGRGRYDQALAALEEGRRLAEEISALWAARFPNQRAWLSAELGDWETAYEIDLAGLRPAQLVPGFREIEISTLINLVLDCTALGRLEEAGSYLAESQKDLGRPEFGSHNWRWSLRLADARARLQLARGETDGAAESIESLLEQVERLEARKYTVRGLALRAQIHLIKSSSSEAVADLLAARRQADSICYLPAQVETRLGLNQLYRQMGSVDLAEQNHAEASRLVAALDRQLHNPELRFSFERGIGKAR
jgi:hypothetical protein